MIKAVIFDLCGVVVKYNDVELTSEEKLLEKDFDYKVDDILFWDLVTNLFHKDKPTLESQSLDILRRYYGLREPDLFSKLPPLKYYVGSNHVSLIKNWLDFVGIKKHFREIFISEDMEVMKPDPGFFKYILDRIDQKPDEILFIDDKPENVESARSVGIKSVVFNGKDQQLSDLVLQNL